MRQIINKVTSRCSQVFRFNIHNDIPNTSTWVKRAVFTTAVVASLSIGSVYADSGKSKDLETVYHVYIKDKRIGTINDKDVIDQVIADKIKNAENNHQNLSFTEGKQVSYVQEQVFNPVYNNSATVTALEEQLAVKADASAIVVNGESVVYVKNQADAEQVIHQIKQQYVSEEVLQKLENSQESSTDPLVPGESTILDVRVSEKVSYKREKTLPKNILSVNKAVELLQKGTLVPKKHTIQKGEVLGRIANQYDLSIDQILEINPGLTEETVLQIGDELVVKDYEPILDVIVEEKVHKSEEIAYETKVIEDDDMFKGTSRVKQDGQEGQKNVLYSIVKTNGKITEKEIIKEEQVKDPVKKIIVKGTKVIPSRGTGDLVWPAVGGYISSDLGYRWGKMHKGIDIAGPSRRTIKAADNGVIAFAGWDGGYGNKIVINHNNGMRTIYAHLSSISVNVGQTVSRGSKIGIMGTTGNSTGIHLHFEVYKNGELQDPQDFF